METSIQTYVNPLSDWGFKRLFGTEMNKDLLLEFLRGLFPERDIRDITYLKNERQSLTERERDSVFDVMCVSADGTQFVVEMQKRSQRYFRDRALYYAAHPIIEQGRRGGWNYRLNPVCVVGVLDFAMEHDYGGESERWRDKLVHRYRLREDETGEIMNSKLEFLYLEVGAYRREVTERDSGEVDVCAEEPVAPGGAAAGAAGEGVRTAVRGGEGCGVYAGGEEPVRKRYDERERLQEHD